MAKHLETGKKGELLAKKYLEDKGFEILEVNWRYRRSEIDIVAMEKEVLVFVEVKTRSTQLWGAPELSVTEKKERLLVDASSAYMEKINHNWEIRFDIISVVLINEKYNEIDHYRDAFFPGLE